MRKILLPPVLLLLCLTGMLLVHFFFASSTWLSQLLRFTGGCLLILGLALPLWGAWVFKKAETNILPYNDPDKLVIHGPFKYSRNPMYLGLLTILLGMALLLGSIVSLFFPLLFFCVANWWYIPFEEKRMAITFGGEYKAYKSRVRRWV